MISSGSPILRAISIGERAARLPRFEPEQRPDVLHVERHRAVADAARRCWRSISGSSSGVGDDAEAAPLLQLFQQRLGDRAADDRLGARSRTRRSGPASAPAAPRRMFFMFSRCELYVLRSLSIDCSSPMSMNRSSNRPHLRVLGGRDREILSAACTGAARPFSDKRTCLPRSGPK